MKGKKVLALVMCAVMAAGMTVPPQGLRLVKIDYLDEKSK